MRNCDDVVDVNVVDVIITTHKTTATTTTTTNNKNNKYLWGTFLLMQPGCQL